MNRFARTWPGLLMLAGVAGCDDKMPENTPPGQVQNSASAINSTSSDTPTGQSNPENPNAGLNTGRPDSMQDVKPGADGNTSPPPR